MKSSCVTFFFLSLCAFLVACAVPGQGGKFNAGKKRGDAIVIALNEYYFRNGKYPVSLEQLGGQFAVVENSSGGNDLKFIYISHGEGGYTLLFKYFGPGSNLCVHESTSASGQWECSGSH